MARETIGDRCPHCNKKQPKKVRAIRMSDEQVQQVIDEFEELGYGIREIVAWYFQQEDDYED